LYATPTLHKVGSAALFTLGMLPLGRPWSPPQRSGWSAGCCPRWLAWIGLLVGLIALINGTMLGSEAAWGFLTGIIWMFTGGIVLALRGTNTLAAPQLDTTAS
jgi:hypothetical protein